MFPNLNAEQARHGHTNKNVADMLGLNRNTYEAKKRNGKFSKDEIDFLCDTYHCSYRYLFNTKPIIPNNQPN